MKHDPVECVVCNSLVPYESKSHLSCHFCGNTFENIKKQDFIECAYCSWINTIEDDDFDDCIRCNFPFEDPVRFDASKWTNEEWPEDERKKEEKLLMIIYNNEGFDRVKEYFNMNEWQRLDKMATFVEERWKNVDSHPAFTMMESLYQKILSFKNKGK